MRIYLTSILVCFSVLGFSQTNDAGAWLNFMLEKDLPDKFTTGIELETRLNENFSEARSIFTELFIKKEWTDDFSTTLTYRALARKELDNTYSDRDRLALDLNYKKKVKKIGIQYRLRLQRALGALGRENALESSIGHRHRFKLSKKLNKKWNMALSGEAFYKIESSEKPNFTDLRVKCGFTYKVKKRNYLSMSYLVQREYNTVNPLTVYNIAVGYTLQIK